jgi:Family of unknown function (DUF6502)
MGRRRMKASEPDPRWRLVEGILRNLFQLVGHLGLPRAEVLARIMKIAADTEMDPKSALTSGRTLEEVHAGAPQVMQAWFRELRFQDAKGAPRHLKLKSGSPNFTDLVHMSAPKLNPALVLDELLTSGSVKLDERGRIVPLTTSVIQSDPAHRAETGLYAVENLLASMRRNLHRPVPTGLFQRECACFRFERKQLPRANCYLREQCLSDLETHDNWLQQYQVPESTEGNPDVVTIIVGTYVAVRETQSD